MNIRTDFNSIQNDIIELVVSQNNTYWDLKEKYDELKKNNELLQKNIAEVHMQRENVDQKYKEELRLRCDVLNELSTTRDLCNALEEYTERLKVGLTNTQSDMMFLCHALQKLAQVVKNMKSQQENAAELYASNVATLTDKIRMYKDHIRQLTQLKTSHSNDQDETQNSTPQEKKEKTKVEAHQPTRNQLEVESKQRAIAILEYLNEMKNHIEKIEKENKEHLHTIESQKELINQQQELITSLQVEPEKTPVTDKESHLQMLEATVRELIGKISRNETSIQDLTNKEHLHTLESQKELINQQQELITSLQVEPEKTPVTDKESHLQMLEATVRELIGKISRNETSIQDLTNKEHLHTIESQKELINQQQELITSLQVEPEKTPVTDKESHLQMLEATVRELIGKISRNETSIQDLTLLKSTNLNLKKCLKQAQAKIGDLKEDLLLAEYTIHTLEEQVKKPEELVPKNNNSMVYDFNSDPSIHEDYGKPEELVPKNNNSMVYDFYSDPSIHEDYGTWCRRSVDKSPKPNLKRRAHDKLQHDENLRLSTDQAGPSHMKNKDTRQKKFFKTKKN